MNTLFSLGKIMKFVPNLLSITRLLLACFFPFSAEELWIWLIIAGGCTDFFDGWIARRFHAQSWQGGLLDAVADKAFILATLLTFTAAGKFSPWWIAAIIARDLTVACAAAYTAFCRLWHCFKKMGARWSGKLATAGQFVLFITIALLPDLTTPILLTTATLSIGAAVDYGWLFYKALQERARQKSL